MYPTNEEIKQRKEWLDEELTTLYSEKEDLNKEIENIELEKEIITKLEQLMKVKE